MLSGRCLSIRPTKLALFDIDGTLFSGQTYLEVFGQLWKQGWRRYPIAQLYVSSLVDRLLYRTGVSAPLKKQERWSARAARVFTNACAAEVRQQMQESWAVVQPLLRDRIVKEVQDRQESGCVVIFASAAVQPIVQGLVDLLAADGGVGTPLEVNSGHYTGQTAGPLCSGKQKVSYALQLELLEGQDIDWQASWAYSDSTRDLGMLESVGHPVAVHPDEELAEHANRNGWPILR